MATCGFIRFHLQGQLAGIHLLLRAGLFVSYQCRAVVAAAAAAVAVAAVVVRVVVADFVLFF